MAIVGPGGALKGLFGSTGVPTDKVAQKPAVLGPNAARRPDAGMFGIRGPFRDILGTLGDAFLMQSGRNPLYGPARQQERQNQARADAMSMLMTNPEQAIQNMIRLGEADTALDMYGNLQNQRAAEAEAMREQNQQAFENTQTIREHAQELLPDYVNQLGAATDEDSLQALLPLVERRYRTVGGLPGMLPTTMAQLEAARRGDYSFGDQVDDQREQMNTESMVERRAAQTATDRERTDIQRYSAQSGRISANASASNAETNRRDQRSRATDRVIGNAISYNNSTRPRSGSSSSGASSVAARLANGGGGSGGGRSTRPPGRYLRPDGSIAIVDENGNVTIKD